MARPKSRPEDPVALRVEVSRADRDTIDRAAGLVRHTSDGSIAGFARAELVRAARDALALRGLGPDGMPLDPPGAGCIEKATVYQKGDTSAPGGVSD